MNKKNIYPGAALVNPATSMFCVVLANQPRKTLYLVIHWRFADWSADRTRVDMHIVSRSESAELSFFHESWHAL